jgi:hypothetical protein
LLHTLSFWLGFILASFGLIIKVRQKAT